MSTTNQLTKNALFNLFHGNNAISGQYAAHANSKSKAKKVTKRDLEIALAVILVDLASCDQKFDA